MSYENYLFSDSPSLAKVGADENDWTTLTMPADSDAINSTFQYAFFDYVSMMAGGYTMDDSYMAYLDT